MSSLQNPIELKEINLFQLLTVCLCSPTGIYIHATDEPASQTPSPFSCSNSSASISSSINFLLISHCLVISAARVVGYSSQMSTTTGRINETIYPLNTGRISIMLLTWYGVIYKMPRSLSGTDSQTWSSEYTKSSVDFRASLILWRSSSSICE